MSIVSRSGSVRVWDVGRRVGLVGCDVGALALRRWGVVER